MQSEVNEEKVGKYFRRREFACRGENCCGHSAPIARELVECLDTLREAIGPIHLNSGYRCHTHNRSIGSKDTSQHPKGTAADIRHDGRNIETMAEAAKTAGFRGIGTYDWGIHVDVRDGKRVLEWGTKRPR
jgi:uncharacterized protein YcbK (DUF882 family)